MKRFLSVVIIVLIAATALLVYRIRSTKNTESDIRTAKAVRTEFIKTVESSGKTQAKNVAELKFALSGKLNWVGVKEGDRVKAYQTIATLDSREVQKNLQKTLYDYSAERSDFEQTWKDNWPQAAQSHEDISHAPSDAIKRILEKNQWDLSKAVLDVELKSLAVEYSSLVSPISGIVTHIDTPIAGVYVTPAGSVFEIVDPDTLIFEANIDEIDVGSLEVGQTATINLDAYPESTFSGVVSNIAYASVISGGGATVFPVEVKFDKPGILRIGLNGDVSIKALSIPESVLIPLEAIREDGTGKYVYKKTSGGYTKTIITTGSQNDTSIIVKSGIAAGDEVVIKGFTQIPQETKSVKP
jgi:HlyD family secretion protein